MPGTSEMSYYDFLSAYGKVSFVLAFDDENEILPFIALSISNVKAEYVHVLGYDYDIACTGHNFSYECSCSMDDVCDDLLRIARGLYVRMNCGIREPIHQLVVNWAMIGDARDALIDLLTNGTDYGVHVSVVCSTSELGTVLSEIRLNDLRHATVQRKCIIV